MKNKLINIISSIVLEILNALILINILIYTFSKKISKYTNNAIQKVYYLAAFILVIIYINYLIFKIRKLKREIKEKLEEDKEEKINSKNIYLILILSLFFFSSIYSSDLKLSSEALEKRNINFKNINSFKILNREKNAKGKSKKNNELENYLNSTYSFKEKNDVIGNTYDYEDKDNPNLIYVNPIKISDISYDYRENVWYISNRINVISKKEKENEDVKKFLENNNLKIVGRIPSTNQYIIKLPKKLDFSSLKKQIEILKINSEYIEDASICSPPFEVVSRLIELGYINKERENSKEERQKIIEELKDKDGYIQINASNFMHIMQIINNNLDIFNDVKIRFSGRIFKSKEDSDILAIGLFQKWCCMLDLSPVGFIIQEKNGADFKIGKYYSVDAKVEIKEMEVSKGVKDKQVVLNILSSKQINDLKDNIIE